jgi:hypothetical protein
VIYSHIRSLQAFQGNVIGLAIIPPFPASMTCSGLRALPSTVISGLLSTTTLSDPAEARTIRRLKPILRPSLSATFAGLRCCHIRPLCAGHRHSPGGLDRLYLLIITSCLSGDVDLQFACRTAAFPIIVVGRLPQLTFRGLLSVHSSYNLHTRGPPERRFYIPCSQHIVTSTPYGIATGWNS